MYQLWKNAKKWLNKCEISEIFQSEEDGDGEERYSGDEGKQMIMANMHTW